MRLDLDISAMNEVEIPACAVNGNAFLDKKDTRAKQSSPRSPKIKGNLFDFDTQLQMI